MTQGDATNPRQKLPAALQMMGSAKSSGTFTARCGDDHAVILLSSGYIVFASSSGGTRLGDAMVAKGVLGADTLKQVLAVQKRKKNKQPLATLLAELGLVSREAAEVIVEQQIYDVINEIMTWPNVTLDFEPMETGFEGVVRPESCSVERVLLNVALN